MTIDEYLNQPRKLKRKRDRLYEKLLAAEERTAPRDPLNLGDGVPGRRSGSNTTEDKLLTYIDASSAYREASRQYTNVRDALNLAIDNLLYWQGCLIYQVYIYNVYFDIDDDLKGADEILRTDNRREILAKLGEAKEALADLLRAQGVEIEQRTTTENGKTNN